MKIPKYIEKRIDKGSRRVETIERRQASGRGDAYTGLLWKCDECRRDKKI